MPVCMSYVPDKYVEKKKKKAPKRLQTSRSISAKTKNLKILLAT